MLDLLMYYRKKKKKKTNSTYIHIHMYKIVPWIWVMHKIRFSANIIQSLVLIGSELFANTFY
jgi:hypothetical protein